MKNTLGDLNNHLFAQLERLNDEELTGEDLEKELKRSKGITDLAEKIISNANTVLQATKLKSELIDDRMDSTPKMLEG